VQFFAINPATKYIIECHSGERRARREAKRYPGGTVDAGSKKLALDLIQGQA
jgi:hypothetical protein